MLPHHYPHPMRRFAAIARRLIPGFAVWGVLTAGTVVKCSSDPGGLGSDVDRPVAADGYYTVAINGTVTGFMKATDPAGLPLVYSLVDGPGQGSLQNFDGKTGRFTYLPATLGVDSFSFRASNGFKVSNSAVITIQVFETSTGSVSGKSAGALQVTDDPATPDAAIVLWNDGLGTLQRTYRGLPVPAETLATGVRSFSIDPLDPRAISASLGSGVTIFSRNGGTDWQEGGPAYVPCPATKQSAAAAPPMSTGCPILPDDSALATEAGADDRAGLSVSLIDDRFRSGTWRWAVSGSRTIVLQTRDGGQTWTVMRELEISNLRLTGCTDADLCLLDGDGTQFWRFETAR